MRHLLIILFLFSLSVISCSDVKEESTTSDDDTTTATDSTVVGASGTILTSSDGTTWNSKTSGWSGILYGVTNSE